MVFRNSGLYCIIVTLGTKRRIKVGELGIFTFTPGTYLYVGSAKKGLSARVDWGSRYRHSKRQGGRDDKIPPKFGVIGSDTVLPLYLPLCPTRFSVRRGSLFGQVLFPSQSLGTGASEDVG